MGRTDISWVRRAWLIYPVLAAAAMVVYFVADHNSFLFNAIGLSSPILILVAVRVHRPHHPWAWYLIAAGQFVFILGDIVSYNYLALSQSMPNLFPLDHTFTPEGDVPFPGLADALYLAVYPLLIAGILLLIRAQSPGRDRVSLLDSLMLTIGVGTISWVLLIEPYVRFTDLSLQTKLTAMAYPLMDILLAGAAIRLAVGLRKKPPAFYLMAAAIVALFVTDAVYAWFGLYTEAGYQPGSGWLEVGWFAFYVLLGMSALHPSMTILSEPATVRDTKTTWPRLALLASAALVPPALLVLQTVRGAEVNGVVLSALSIALFLLVIVRMVVMIRMQERSAMRERALRESAAALVTATSREEILEAATGAARTLVAMPAAIRLCEEQSGSVGDLVVVSSVGGADALGARFPFASLQSWKRERLLKNQTYVVPTNESQLRGSLRLANDEGSVFVAPLFILDDLRGLMVVATGDPMSYAVVDSLHALSSQVALALESAALTQDLLLRQSEARFASLVKNSTDVVTVLEPDTTIRYASPSAMRVLGYPELEGTRFIDLVHPEDITQVLAFLSPTADAEGHPALLEFQLRCADGTWVHTETLRTALLHDPTVSGIVLNTRDVSERKTFEEQLAHQAFHDSVTGLANRALFRDRVLHALERRQRDDGTVAVLFMDLDDFKTVNDSMGHAAGDHLLREVADRLREQLRAADTAARFGGDEFAILIEDADGGLGAVDVAERLLRALERPFSVEGKEVYVRGSIGIATSDGSETGLDDEVAEDLLRSADVAMYMAKESGKGRYQVFEQSMHETALKRLELKGDLQRALDHGEFVIHYQPVIELESGRISGVEALVRWQHPERGLVPPLEFIPLAEETGLIVPIGRWVMREACAYAVRLRELMHGTSIHMAVNLSARQLQRPEIVRDVADILEETQLPPELLVIEITESVMMQDMDLSIERLAQLKHLGVQLAIDDFGTGYSSLNYVRRFPVDILKVDKSFIDGVSEGGESSALTAAVIELAGILNLTPVAEGIERADQLQRLLELRCELGQGFLFAKPLEASALESLLAERTQMLREAEGLATAGVDEESPIT
jgi:diguanylate cyclase (GGDEF)-like protein/PAS domain S-box-containing protein